MLENKCYGERNPAKSDPTYYITNVNIYTYRYILQISTNIYKKKFFDLVSPQTQLGFLLFAVPNSKLHGLYFEFPYALSRVDIREAIQSWGWSLLEEYHCDEVALQVFLPAGRWEMGRLP